MPVFAVWVTPSEAPPEREGALIANLSALTGERAEDLRSKLALARQDGRPSARVAIGIPRESALAIEERRHELPGVSVRIVTRRQYLHGDVMGHMVGFTGPIPAEQADAYRAQGLRLDEEIGPRRSRAQPPIVAARQRRSPRYRDRRTGSQTQRAYGRSAA